MRECLDWDGFSRDDYAMKRHVVKNYGEDDIGLACVKEKGKFRVSSVTLSGAAFRAGIEKGDILCRFRRNAEADASVKTEAWADDTLGQLDSIYPCRAFSIKVRADPPTERRALSRIKFATRTKVCAS